MKLHIVDNTLIAQHDDVMHVGYKFSDGTLVVVHENITDPHNPTIEICEGTPNHESIGEEYMDLIKQAVEDKVWVIKKIESLFGPIFGDANVTVIPINLDRLSEKPTIH